MKVDGEGITAIAREQCFYSYNFKFGMDLLEGSLQTDQLTQNEIKGLAFAILDGRATIKGIYPDGDYHFEYLEEKDNKWDIASLIEKLNKKREAAEKETEEISQKFCFLAERLSSWEAKSANREYKQEFGTNLFEDMEEENELPLFGEIENFLKRMKDTEEHSTEDYGWLDPNGNFYGVEWGDHQKWASKWLCENLSEEYGEHERIVLYKAGDELIKRGWVLLHNLSQGIAFPTSDPTKTMTKAQKEFLYDYFVERNCMKAANEVWEGE